MAAYQKFHSKGFEIIGISLDQDKSALLSFTKEKGMVWPQYFDGKGFDNEIVLRYGIDQIPTMWLVGKDGKIITLDAEVDLPGNIKKALAKP